MTQEFNSDISISINNFLNTLADEVEKALIILSAETADKMTVSAS